MATNREKERQIVERARERGMSDEKIKEAIIQYRSTGTDNVPVKKTGLISSAIKGVQSAAAKRFASVADTYRATVSGDINPLETGIQTVGAAAGFLGDIGGEVAKTTVGAVSGAYEALPEPIKATAQMIGSITPADEIVAMGAELLKSPVGQAALSSAAKGVEAYGVWKEENPRIAKNLESVVNIASLFPMTKGAQVVAPEVKTAISGAVGAGVRGAESVVDAARATAQAATKVPEATKTVAQAATETAQRIGESVKRGGSSVIEDVAERAAMRSADPIVAEATRVGIAPDVITRVKTASPDTKLIMSRMVDAASNTITNTAEGVRNKIRHVQVAGQALADRAAFLAGKLRSTGKQLGEVKQALKGKKADVSALQSTLIDDMDNLGLTFAENGRVVAEEGVPIADDLLEVIDDLNKYIGGTSEKSAINLDRLRQYLFKEYTKQGVPLKGPALGLVEKYRSLLLDNLSKLDSTYGQLASQYADQRKGLGDFAQLLGYKGSIENIGAKSLRAGEVAQRILGNAADRPQSIIDELERLVQEAGYAGKEDIYDLIKFADELEDIVRTQTKNLSGQVERGTTAALSKAGIVGKLIDSVSRLGAPQAKEQLEVLRKLIGDLPKAQGAATPSLSAKVMKDLAAMYLVAPQTKLEIDTLAKLVSDEIGGTLVTAPLKQIDASLEKVLSRKGGNASKLTDIARNTIGVSSTDQIDSVIKQLSSKSDVVEIDIVPRGADPAGYTGGKVLVRTANGQVGEIQVNTVKMLYAKGSKEMFIEMFGKSSYDAIRHETGLEGGLGHKIYEEIRDLRAKDPTNKRIGALEQDSREYYRYFY